MKLYQILFFCLLLSFIFSQRFEAEDQNFVGLEVSTQLEGYSGKGYLTGMDNSGDMVSFNFNLQISGLYQIVVRYASIYGDKQNAVQVGKEKLGDVLFKQSSTWNNAILGKTWLNSGTQQLTITKSWGYIEIDYIQLNLATMPSFTVSNELVTPNPLPQTQDLMNYLIINFGKKIISGQHGYSGQEQTYIKQLTGKTPKIQGFDLLNYSPVAPISYQDQAPEKAIDYYVNQKGVVEFQWHWFSPSGATAEIWKSFYSDKTNFDVSKAVTPGTTEYNQLISDIDKIAVQFKKFLANGVPVLWRPLHEAEGKWFWWGKFGPEPCKKLWRIMFNKFVYEYKFNNLIWVWTTTNSNQALDWYPGDDVVDILGLDIYRSEGDYSALSFDFFSTYELFKYKKIVALTENGPIPDINDAISSKAYWSWFATWNGYFILDGKQNSQQHIKDVFNNPYVLNL